MTASSEKHLAPRPRGTGSIYRRRQDGNRIWWIRTHHGAKPESSGSIRKKFAQDLLDQRLAERRMGQLAPERVSGRCSLTDLERMVLGDMRANGRRSVRNVELSILPPQRTFFGTM